MTIANDGHVVLSNSIAFNAETAAANRLDDYEEGSWTPSVKSNNSAITLSGTQDGIYTKIGRMVYAQFNISGTVSGGAYSSNNQVIGGLPFTSAAVNQNGVGLVQDVSGISYASGAGDIYGRVNASVAECQLLQKQDDGSTHSGNPSFSNGTFTLRGMVIYYT